MGGVRRSIVINLYSLRKEEKKSGRGVLIRYFRIDIFSKLSNLFLSYRNNK